MSESGSHYTVLARRCRPQTFAEVVGQERIGQALRNAIRARRVAHAYLFTGARGVGKTSTARILAKALNCPHVQDGVPCNDCDVCQSIGSGGDVDVLEIDGASNRGIDDIRSLRANVTIRAMRSPFKVYIIDEVHMLTKEAFNALLKTLEEPPPNVIFVFCTTEPNKVPDTILSRCQRFDFGTIAASSIQTRLQQIAQSEGVNVEPAALELLSRRAAGSMRDSQSLLDQLLAFGSERITVGDVHQLLGTASDDRLIELIEACIERRREAALLLVDTALAEGVQTGSLSDQLLDCLRDLMVVVVGADEVPLLGIGESQRARLVELANRWGLYTITAAQQILVETKARMQRGGHERMLLELGLIRLSLLEEITEIGAILSGSQGGSSPPESRRTPTSPAARPGTPRDGAPSGRPFSQGSSNSQATAPNLRATEVSSPHSTIDLSESSKNEFWSELLSLLADKIATHLSKAESIAISGPNRLEILFAPSYFLSKQFCERAETYARISEVAGRVAGRLVDVAIGVSRSGLPDSGSGGRIDHQARAVGQRKSAMTADGDPYIQQAVSIFGGRIEDVRRVQYSVGDDRG